MNIFAVNFPVVAGGFALLATTGAAQLAGGVAVPIFSSSFVGGAASLIGM